MAQKWNSEKNGPASIVFIVCDGAWKYLSTGAYAEDLDVIAESLSDVIYF